MKVVLITHTFFIYLSLTSIPLFIPSLFSIPSFIFSIFLFLNFYITLYLLVEPMVKVVLITPETYYGAMMDIVKERRGIKIETQFLDDGQVS